MQQSEAPKTLPMQMGVFLGSVRGGGLQTTAWIKEPLTNSGKDAIAAVRVAWPPLSDKGKQELNGPRTDR